MMPSDWRADRTVLDDAGEVVATIVEPPRARPAEESGRDPVTAGTGILGVARWRA
jgi:hypothetical protein